jgi:hypothetical protein
MKGHPTEELGVFNKLKEISAVIQPGDICGDDTEKADRVIRALTIRSFTT